MNDLIFGDCFECLESIESESVNVILTDPPYNISGCNWDKLPIDTVLLFDEFRRIIKENGTIIVFGVNPFSAKIIMENLDIYRYSCVWVKSNSTTPHLAHKQPMRRYEDINIFYKKKNVYHPIMQEGKPYKWKSTRSGGESSHIKYKHDNEINNSGTRYPTNVFEFKQERGLHSTQKPVPLFKMLIEMYSDVGDTILDPFCGSGTTAIACMESGRNYICIENDKTIFDVAYKRVYKNGCNKA